MLLTELVLVGSLDPSSLLIQAGTVSHHSHLLFRTDTGQVIDSTLKHGGVELHDPDHRIRPWELRLILAKHFTVADIALMTSRAVACRGVGYDLEGIIEHYVPNHPESDWRQQLWCFEYGYVVLGDKMPIDHRPDRAVGRHWVAAIKEMERRIR